MPEGNHCAGGRVAKPTSRRKEKKAAKKRERGQSDKALANAAAALHNSRARRLHQIIRKPGRGGLTPKAAQQLQNYFSKKVPQSEKLSLREMDESAAMIMLQMAAEEVDGGGLSHGDLKKVAEDLFEKNGEGGRGTGKVEKDMKMEETTEAKKSLDVKEKRELGDTAAKATEFKLCIRSSIH